MGVTLSDAGVSQATLDDPLSDLRVAFDTQFEQAMADSLNRPVTSVNVDDVELSRRRLLAGEFPNTHAHNAHTRPPLVGGTVSVTACCVLVPSLSMTLLSSPV
jgi:hypothetical protein